MRIDVATDLEMLLLTLNLSCCHETQSQNCKVGIPRFTQILPFRLGWTRLVQALVVDLGLLLPLLLLSAADGATSDRNQALDPHIKTMTLIAPPAGLIYAQHEGGSLSILGRKGHELSVPTEKSQSSVPPPALADNAAPPRLPQPELPEKEAPGLPLPPPASAEPVLPVRTGASLRATSSTVDTAPLLPAGVGRGSSLPGSDDGQAIQRPGLLPIPTSAATRRMGAGSDSQADVLGRPRPKAPTRQTSNNGATSDEAVSISSMPRLEYTTCARQNRLEGFVRVHALFASTGIVTETATIGQPLGCGLEEAAQVTVRAMKFRPARSGGKEIDQWLVVVAHYQLAVQSLTIQ
jgi:hypothetical protein